MARSGKTAQEFIQSSFSPITALLCSPKVEDVVSKNNLSLPELLQPFSSLDWEGQFREPGGSLCAVKNLKLIIRDVNWKPLQPIDARRQLNNAVLSNYNDNMVALELEGRKLEVPQSTPWFDAWRETYFEVQFPSDHEYTKHFLSCIIVGTTLDDNIVDTYNLLNQQFTQLQNIAPPKLPKWFNNEVLKSYLLLHDVATVSKEKADAAFESLKQSFGANNCFMLSINSKTTVDPCLQHDYWAKYVNRTLETNTETVSSVTATTFESQVVPPSINLVPEENIMAGSTNVEVMHPLSAENEMYDNANSLQTHSFSGSTESVSVSGKPFDNSTEVYGAALNANDVEGIKKFLQEYASKALLPYIEKQISMLTEAVATRKGFSRSFISATKRWLGTGKTGNTTVNNTVIYAGECPELQLRRLGDLWFLCGQWQRAFDAYHTAKREFYADSAWLCYAGALEMAALSAFMAGESNRKTHGYMEESIVMYLNTCRMVQYAVRATLLSVLCLNSAGLPGEAAKQLIRMTSEDSDLRSAMLLEQASLCFLAAPGAKAMCRKYAFHMVLSGHRFSKAGQKKHAFRCYKQAYQVYISGGWRLATDHVQFTLGRLAGALRRPRAAERWLRAPLAPPQRQPAHQQRAFLQEYMRVHQQFIESTDEFKESLPILPLPLLDINSTAILCVGPAPLSSPGRRPATSLALGNEDNHYWNKMEEMLLQVVHGSVPMIFKPSIDLYTAKTDSNPVVPQGEPIQISITLQNPLLIGLILKEVELLWRFVPNADSVESHEEALMNEPVVAAGNALETTVIYGQKLKSVILEGDCKKVLTFSLTPLRVGNLYIQGLAYKLINVGEDGSESTGTPIAGKLELDGTSGNDKRMQIVVIPEAPCLQMTFSETNPEVLSGEMRSIDVELRNVGPIDMKNVYIAVSHPDCLCFATPDSTDDPFKILYDEKYSEMPNYSDERAARAAAWRAAASRPVHRVAAVVPRGGATRAQLLLRPRAATPSEPPPRLLAYYATGNALRPYRLLRHVFQFDVSEVVEVSATPRQSIRNIDGQLMEIMNLVVEVKNVSNEKSDISIELLEASLLSRQWKLTDMTKAKNNDDRLISHERLHVVFKAKRVLTPLPSGKVDFSSIKNVENHSDCKDDVNVAPYSKFLMEYKQAYVDNPESLVDNDRSGLIRSMFVIRWKANNKAKGTTAIGQHSLWLKCFTRAETLEKLHKSINSPALLDDFDLKLDVTDKKKNKDNVVVFRFEHSHLINHDFKVRRLCLVPITINIVNCYGIPIKVFIDMASRQKRDTFNIMGWAGALSNGPDSESKELGVNLQLDKFESRRMQMSAVCAAPGTYIVGSAFNVTTCRVDNSQTVTHIGNNNTSLLVVKQA